MLSGVKKRHEATCNEFAGWCLGVHLWFSFLDFVIYSAGREQNAPSPSQDWRRALPTVPYHSSGRPAPVSGPCLACVRCTSSQRKVPQTQAVTVAVPLNEASTGQFYPPVPSASSKRREPRAVKSRWAGKRDLYADHDVSNSSLVPSYPLSLPQVTAKSVASGFRQPMIENLKKVEVPRYLQPRILQWYATPGGQDPQRTDDSISGLPPSSQNPRPPVRTTR